VCRFGGSSSAWFLLSVAYVIDGHGLSQPTSQLRCFLYRRYSKVSALRSGLRGRAFGVLWWQQCPVPLQWSVGFFIMSHTGNDHSQILGMKSVPWLSEWDATVAGIGENYDHLLKTSHVPSPPCTPCSFLSFSRTPNTMRYNMKQRHPLVSYKDGNPFYISTAFLAIAIAPLKLLFPPMNPLACTKTHPSMLVTLSNSSSLTPLHASGSAFLLAKLSPLTPTA